METLLYGKIRAYIAYAKLRYPLYYDRVEVDLLCETRRYVAMNSARSSLQQAALPVQVPGAHSVDAEDLRGCRACTGVHGHDAAAPGDSSLGHDRQQRDAIWNSDDLDLDSWFKPVSLAQRFRYHEPAGTIDARLHGSG